MVDGKRGTAVLGAPAFAKATADKPVPSPASLGREWGLPSPHCSAAVAAAVMTALGASPVCFSGGTVLYLQRPHRPLACAAIPSVSSVPHVPGKWRRRGGTGGTKGTGGTSPPRDAGERWGHIQATLNLTGRI